MRYGYELLPTVDGDFGTKVKDHTNVLYATLHLVLWQLCRVDMLKGHFKQGIIFDAETGKKLYTVTPDSVIIQLEQDRETNREEWEKVVGQLTREDWRLKTAKYKEIAPKTEKFKKNDENILKAIDARVKELLKVYAPETVEK